MSLSTITALKQQGGQLFDKRATLLSLWQEIAENFYVERADFTTSRNIGEDMASNLTSSFPLIVRRDLGNAFSSMLRPTAKDWFKLSAKRTDLLDITGKQWLEWITGLMKSAMYDRDSQFTRATKEGDHDFAAFGQACLSVELNRRGNGLLYRCWHLRDVAWAEDSEGKISNIYRRWKPTVRDLCAMFPKTVHPKVREKLDKTPYAEVNVWHIVLPSEDYKVLDGAKTIRQPWVSIYLDVDNDLEMEVSGSWSRRYVIPRWQTVSGSQYAYSPAVVASLPDARTLQAMSLTLMEAGEKAVSPPMVAVQEAIRGDMALFAGGVTWVDAEYDERLGEVLRPLTQEKGGLAFGHEMLQDLREQMGGAWFLNKLNLPPVGGPDMTAYEVGQRVQEFIRNALPLFEPMEYDYNGQLCDMTLEILLRDPGIKRTIPASLRGMDTEFKFESPLHEATEKLKLGKFMEAQQVLAQAIQLDPGIRHLVDGLKATRDVLGATVPAAWLRTEAAVDKLTAADQQAVAAQQQLAAMQQGADVAKTLADAGLGQPNMPVGA
jgi:hypothetical protein